jgi:hypothetical protein
MLVEGGVVEVMLAPEVQVVTAVAATEHQQPVVVYHKMVQVIEVVVVEGPPAEIMQVAIPQDQGGQASSY